MKGFDNMDFIQLAKARYSVRNFKEQQVEDEKLALILEAGRVAPTAANCQPQKVIVIRDKSNIDKVNKAANTYKAPLLLVVCADKNEGWTRPFDNKQSYDIDAAIVTDHMMLEATDLGLGSVWICYFNPDILKDVLQLPDNIEPVNILAIGYSDGEALSPDRHDGLRKSLSQTVFYEEFK